MYAVWKTDRAAGPGASRPCRSRSTPGNASFFLLLSVFPVVSLLLSLLPYTALKLDHLLAFCEEFAPDWTLRALEFFVRTLYTSSSAAIISASAVLTLWSASKGMLSLLYGLDAVAEVARDARLCAKAASVRALYGRDAAGAASDAGALCRRAGAAAVSDGALAFPSRRCSSLCCGICIWCRWCC